jgi:hypothetical protein
MTFAEKALSRDRLGSIRITSFFHRQQYYPSPVDWRDETL